MSSLGKLYVEFAAKGLDDVKKGIEALKLQMQASQARSQSLRHSLQQINLAGKQQGGLTSKQKKDRLDLLKSLLKEQQHYRQLQGMESGLTKQVKARSGAIAETAKGMDKMQGAVGTLAASLAHMGAIATGAFAAGVSGMLAFAAAADPVGFRMFQAQLQILAIRIGRIFIPVLRQLTQWVKKVSQFFKDLTPEQKRTIRGFALVGVAILGVIGVLASFAAALLGLIPVVATVVTTINAILTAGTGGLWALVPIIGVIITAILGLLGVTATAGASLVVMGQKGNGIMEKLQNAIKALYQPLQVVIGFFERLWNVVVNFAKAMANVLAEMLGISDASDSWAQAMDFISGVFEWLSDFAIETLIEVGKYVIAVTDFINQLGKTLYWAFTAAVPPVDALIAALQTMKGLLDGIVPLLDSVFQAALPISGVASGLASSLIPTLGVDFNQISKKMDDFETRVRKGDREIKSKYKRKGKEQGESKGKLEPDETPMALGKTPQLLDIAEVWRKAQTSMQNDPMMLVQKELLDGQREANNLAREGNDNLRTIKNEVAKTGLR